MRKISSVLLLAFVLSLTALGQQTQIIVNAGGDLGAFDLLIGTNCGPFGTQGIEDYTQIFKDLGIKTIRTHDYYGPCDWYRIFPYWSRDPNDPASYDFESTDTVIKRIIDAEFEVLFRIGPSWNDDVYEYHTDPPGTLRDNQGNITHIADLNDFVKFAEICKHIVMHYNAGWANGFQYNIKKWEIWNEPSLQNHFWSGTPFQFYQLFKSVIQTLKAYDSSLFIGGPGLAGSLSQAYHEGLIAYCSQNNIPLDFFSWHSYGGMLLNTPLDFEDKTALLRGLLDSYGYTETTLICDEWNANLDVANYADSGKGAAFYACALAAFIENNIPECYQYRADNHSLGLVLSNGQLKTAAYSLKAWKELTESTIRLETEGTDTLEFIALASRSADNSSFWVLLSNFLDETKQISLQINNVSYQPNNGWKLTTRVINDTLKLEEVSTTNIGTGTALSSSFDLQPESVQLLKITPAASTGDGEGGGGDSRRNGQSGCFIATACYGTSLAEEVKVLSMFRDRYLNSSSIGRALVRLYYKHSPGLASIIQERDYLKAAIRKCLKPLIWIIRMIE